MWLERLVWFWFVWTIAEIQVYSTQYGKRNWSRQGNLMTTWFSAYCKNPLNISSARGLLEQLVWFGLTPPNTTKEPGHDKNNWCQDDSVIRVSEKCDYRTNNSLVSRQVRFSYLEQNCWPDNPPLNKFVSRQNTLQQRLGQLSPKPSSPPGLNCVNTAWEIHQRCSRGSPGPREGTAVREWGSIVRKEIVVVDFLSQARLPASAAGDRQFMTNATILALKVGKQSIVTTPGYSADCCTVAPAHGNSILKNEFTKNTNICKVSSTQDYSKDCCVIVRSRFFCKST